MRAFIAIDLPETIQAALGRQQANFRAACAPRPRRDELDEAVRWTRPEGIHLTLKFLGEISEKRITQVTEALAGIEPFETFPIEVKGLGFFPDARRPRVFWVGVEAPTALERLAGRVEASMEKLGFAPEQRAFNPHLTLARFKAHKPQPALMAFLERQGELTLGHFDVSEFFLFESKLTPYGAEYRKLARFPRL